MSFASIFLFILFNHLANIVPGYPNITGSKLIVEGNSVTLTCTSSGAYPVPTVYWYRNVQLVDDTQTTTNCVTSNTYNFVADKSHNLAVFECQVDNNVLQNKLRTTWYFHVYTIPNQLTLNGSQTLSLGTTYQWACISTGGNPSPIMTLWIGNSQFSTGITQTSVLQSDKTYTVTSTLSWAPSVSNNGQTLYCDVKHQETRGYNMQTASLQLTVNDVPDVTITQPSQGSSGQAITIQCSYISNPKASHVKWSKGNQGITVDDYKYNGGSLSNPSLTIINLAASDQGSYRCSVVNSVGQGDSSYVTLSVDTSVSGPDAAVVVDDTSGLSSGEIVAIILAILFVLLSFLVVCCCCKGYCASLCGRKQEQVTQKVEHKRVEIPVYNKETVESVIHLHKLGIPKFYENPEPSVRKTRIEKYGVHRRQSVEFDINTSQVVKLEDIKQIETTERSRDNTYVTPTGTCKQYPPNIEYTYDEEEEQRRRRRRRRKNSKRDQDKQMHEHIVHQIET